MPNNYLDFKCLITSGFILLCQTINLKHRVIKPAINPDYIYRGYNRDEGGSKNQNPFADEVWIDPGGDSGTL